MFWQAALGWTRLSTFNREEIAAANAWLESLPPAEQPVELLKWAHKTLEPGSWVQFTSFGTFPNNFPILSSKNTFPSFRDFSSVSSVVVTVYSLFLVRSRYFSPRDAAAFPVG